MAKNSMLIVNIIKMPVLFMLTCKEAQLDPNLNPKLYSRNNKCILNDMQKAQNIQHNSKKKTKSKERYYPIWRPFIKLVDSISWIIDEIIEKNRLMEWNKRPQTDPHRYGQLKCWENSKCNSVEETKGSVLKKYCWNSYTFRWKIKPKLRRE